MGATTSDSLNVDLDAAQQIPPVERLFDIAKRASIVTLKVEQHLPMPLDRIQLR